MEMNLKIVHITPATILIAELEKEPVSYVARETPSPPLPLQQI